MYICNAPNLWGICKLRGEFLCIYINVAMETIAFGADFNRRAIPIYHTLSNDISAVVSVRGRVLPAVQTMVMILQGRGDTPYVWGVEMTSAEISSLILNWQ